jgi:preprotein translocase subunit SecF
MIGLSLIQPIHGYAQQIVLLAIKTTQGSESSFVMDISNYARAQLIHGLFAGFMSGVMFAVALVKWIEQRRSHPLPRLGS